MKTVLKHVRKLRRRIPLEDRTFRYFYKLSRPKYWMYIAAPYIFGYTAGIQSLHEYVSMSFLYSVFFFLFPANLMIYAINDVADVDNDYENPKKIKREVRFKEEDGPRLLVGVLIAALIGLPLFLSTDNRILGSMIFLYISILIYNVPPFRLKARPIVDMLLNSMYVLPAVIGYVQSAHVMLNFYVLVGACLWAFATYLFSATQDVYVDQRAGLRTTAVYLGKRNALIACAVWWLLSGAVLGFMIHPALWVVSLYAGVPLYGLKKDVATLEKLYGYMQKANIALAILVYFLVLHI